MTTSVQNSPISGYSYVEEKGFRYEFPTSIAEELVRYLEGMKNEMKEFSMGEWVLALPFGKRMRINIQLTR